MDVDVLVVGAGPAGSTTARYCADKRLDVLIIDRRGEIGYPVQCGEFLPDTQEMYSIFPKSMELEELFELERALVAAETECMDLISPRGRTYRCEFRSKVLNRRSFDKHLVKLAVEAGARLETNTSLLTVKDKIARTSTGDVKAKVIVGADGPNSRTARSVGISNPKLRYPAVTCQADGSFEPAVKMYFGNIAPGGYAWVIPKKKTANVGIGVNPLLTDELPSKVFGRFVSRLGCAYRDVTMGFVPMSGPVWPTVKGNVLLVGDSAGFVMPPNGGGIPTAMIGGRFAGKVIKEHLLKGEPLAAYEKTWRRVLGKPLADGLRTRKLADRFFPSDRALEFAMRMLGRRGLDRAIRCKRSFYVL